MTIPTDTALVDFLEKANTLHTTVEMLYVVDGYQVSLCHDGNPVREFHGETLREALAKAAASVSPLEPLPGADELAARANNVGQIGRLLRICDDAGLGDKARAALSVGKE